MSISGCMALHVIRYLSIMTKPCAPSRTSAQGSSAWHQTVPDLSTKFQDAAQPKALRGNDRAPKSHLGHVVSRGQYACG